MGLSIAFIGLRNGGIVAVDSETFVNLTSFSLLFGTALWSGVMPVLVTLDALIVIAVINIQVGKGRCP